MARRRRVAVAQLKFSPGVGLEQTRASETLKSARRWSHPLALGWMDFLRANVAATDLNAVPKR